MQDKHSSHCSEYNITTLHLRKVLCNTLILNSTADSNKCDHCNQRYYSSWSYCHSWGTLAAKEKSRHEQDTLGPVSQRYFWLAYCVKPNGCPTKKDENMAPNLWIAYIVMKRVTRRERVLETAVTSWKYTAVTVWSNCSVSHVFSFKKNKASIHGKLVPLKIVKN